MSELEKQVQYIENLATYDYIFKNCDYNHPAYKIALHNITNHEHNMTWSQLH